MIKNLLIKNFAIIDELLINFDSGLTVITGETGSGKSIIIESLLILSESFSSLSYCMFYNKLFFAFLEI